MPLFRYEAIDKKGSSYTNVWTASSLDEAKRQLRQQGILVRSIDLQHSHKLRLTQDQIASFFHQLSLLMHAGFPLYEALVALQDQYENEPIHDMLMIISEQIHAGSQLADALACYPFFESSLIAMIRSGERGANLSTVLERVSQVMRAQERIKKQLITAMIYPALLAAVSMAILLLMLLMVVPALEPLFEGAAPSSSLTVAVFALSRALRYYGLYLLIGVGLALLLLGPWLRSYIQQGRWHDLAFKVPLLGSLMLRSRLARFGFVMQALLESGVPLVDALEMGAPLLKIGPLTPIIEQASQRVLQGESLSQALHNPHMPKLLTRLIRLGENSGNLGQSFAHLQQMMDEELQKDLARLTAVAQPVILVIMGTLVGLIMAAILIPLTDMGRFQAL